MRPSVSPDIMPANRTRKHEIPAYANHSIDPNGIDSAPSSRPTIRAAINTFSGCIPLPKLQVPNSCNSVQESIFFLGLLQVMVATTSTITVIVVVEVTVVIGGGEVKEKRDYYFPPQFGCSAVNALGVGFVFFPQQFDIFGVMRSADVATPGWGLCGAQSKESRFPIVQSMHTRTKPKYTEEIIKSKIIIKILLPRKDALTIRWKLGLS